MAGATLVEDSSAGNPCPMPFTFHDHPIRTVIVDEQPWFVARDVCAALTIPWRGDTIKSIPEVWRCMRSFRIRQKNGRERGQEISIIAEPAVYKLAFRSNKPEADAFTNWVASEVLPAIRKTGQYAAQATPTGQITPAQCRHLHDIMDAKVSTRPNASRRAAYAEAWTRFNRHFRIAKYDQLPQDKYTEALSYLINIGLKSAQKALPAATAQSSPPLALPENYQRDELIREIQRHSGNAHDAVTRMWTMIWKDVESWRWEQDKPLLFAQLKHLGDAVFDQLSSNIEAVRRLARTIDVTYRETRQMRG